MADEEDTRRWKCSLVDNKITPCWPLDETLGDPYGRGTRAQGITLHNMVNMETGKFAGSTIVLKSGKHGKKGFMVNYCPFCGEMINRHLLADTALSAATGSGE